MKRSCSPTGGQSSSACASAGVEPFPHHTRSARATQRCATPRGLDRRRGVGGSPTRRRTDRRPPRAWQGRVHRLVDGTGRIQLHSRADVLGTERTTAGRGWTPATSSAPTGTSSRPGAASCRCGSRGWDAAGQEPAPAARQVPRPRGHRAALPPPRARPDRQPGGPRTVPKRGASDRGGARVARRAGLLEVETPVLQPLYGGARRVRSSPSTTRSTAALPADRDELYLKRSWSGVERVYEIGQDFRNEGIDRDAQPGVHDARVL